MPTAPPRKQNNNPIKTEKKMDIKSRVNAALSKVLEMNQDLNDADFEQLLDQMKYAIDEFQEEMTNCIEEREE